MAIPVASAQAFGDMIGGGKQLFIPQNPGSAGSRYALESYSRPRFANSR